MVAETIVHPIDARTGLEELTQRECLQLARRCAIGRLAVVVDGQPLVFPVNFTLDGHAVVLRTGEGTKLNGAREHLVAFEYDDIDRMSHIGWSVLITGRADVVGEPTEVARLEQLPIGPWCPGPAATWLRIRPRTITGRRIVPHGSHPSAQMERKV
jgi:uncharacterized protein